MGACLRLSTGNNDPYVGVAKIYDFEIVADDDDGAGGLDAFLSGPIEAGNI